MEALQQEFQTAILKFQIQERETIQTEFKEEVVALRQKLDSKNKQLKFLEQENVKLKNVYQHINNNLGGVMETTIETIVNHISKLISTSLRDTNMQRHLVETAKAHLFAGISTETETDEKGSESKLYSIKDRIKYMKHDPKNFTKQLSSIGKKMAEYYRKSHNGEDPSKRDEKINDKHTSPVCVYSEEDWEYMDYLIKTSLEIQ